ncbi:MAG: TrbG/VirB9 family P-type conjugative transfer protein [Gammaproteobacteria bacterium]|nr:TrbG/VirB9 family P-type conjugative transfer protein [Gammaproteobacteria bacterium]
MRRRVMLGATLLLALPAALHGQDGRIRSELYAADEVYRLPGFVGYQIDLEFEPGEAFLGLGAGDAEGVTYAAQANHLFLKPRASGVRTNLTVLTSRRTYHFQYVVSAGQPDPDSQEVLYVLRFLYPLVVPPPSSPESPSPVVRPQHTDYAYAGSPALRPTAAWDDGVRTWLRFGLHQELPAVFARNADGSESLVNWHMEAGVLVIHRIASAFTVRRGGLAGCIVNQGKATPAPGMRGTR